MTTLQHLTEDHSQDEQTSSVPGSPANLTALQENVSRLLTSVIFGARSSEFWGKRNPDGFWEKMCQDCLALNLEISSVGSSMTWPKWGIALDGVVMELQMSAQSTGGKESSSLLGTPTTNDAKNSLTESQRGRGTLTAGLLPTPRASQEYKPVRQLSPSEANGSHGTVLVGAIGNELDVATGAGVVLNPRFVEWMMMFPTGWLD